MSEEIKEIVQDYVLIVFDIPQSQGKLRKLILKKIHEIGGEMNTSSVYLMPYSAGAMALAEAIKPYGDVVVWKSHQDDPVKAKGITIDYAGKVMARCQLISLRFSMINSYIEEGQFGRATHMIIKTKTFIDQVKKINETFSPPWLPEKIAEFDALLAQVMNVGKVP